MNIRRCRVAFPVIFCLLGTIYAEISDLKSELDGCLLRLNSGVEKAFKDVGMTKRDVRAAMAAQLPPQEVWKPYRQAWPTVHKVREQAAVEMAALGSEGQSKSVAPADQNRDTPGLFTPPETGCQFVSIHIF